ncbi:GGDEF domain-containing protein [Sinorhizobium sp. CB9]
MILDMRTIYLVCAVTCLVLGALQLLAYATGRFERWPKWWGISNLLLGLGSLAIAMRGIGPDVVSVELGNIATLCGYIALLIAIRVFSGTRVSLAPYGLVAFVGSLPIVFTLNDPSAYLTRIAYLSGIFACCDIAVMLEGVRLAKREKLVSAWILVGLFAPTAVMFAGRAFLAAIGNLGGNDILDNAGGLHQWMAITAAVFVALRGITIVLMASERGRNMLLELAHHDPLTGVMNRMGLQQMLEEHAAGHGASGKLVVILIDVDRFKALNDTHGHAAGDRILRVFAELARGQLGVGDILARQGGDEFVAVLKNVSLEEAAATAEGIRKSFEERIAAASLKVRPTLSIGVAEGDAGAEGLAAIMHKADEALYRSKREGRNRVEIYYQTEKAA